jgi:hypothetical protein
VDRECLDGEVLRPERILWWEYGVEWVKEMSVRGVGDLPRHRDYHVDEVCDVGVWDLEFGLFMMVAWSK